MSTINFEKESVDRLARPRCPEREEVLLIATRGLLHPGGHAA